jgi:hypothetical protein
VATVVTNTGKAIAAARMRGATPAQAEPLYVGWGTGAGTAATGDTTLFSETGTRVAGTTSNVTTTVTSDTWQVVAAITAGSALTITNAGAFDAASAGNLFVKGDFTGVALASGDSITFTIKVAFA